MPVKNGNTQQSAFIAIVGRPNVGKSSLLNALLGHKVAIVSKKPQTTRTRIMGVLTRGETQLVFIDTPGLHKPKTRLGEAMVKSIADSISGVDASLLVVEAGMDIQKAEMELMERFRKEGIPAILAINKIDILPDKTKLMEQITAFTAQYDFEAVVPVSATKPDGIETLTAELMKQSAESPHFFDGDALTDQPERVIASEIIREKLLRLLDKEIPHGIAVGIEKMREREAGNVTDIDAVIYCERESHKRIIIGKQGSMLKKVGSYAREDMERFFGCKINLQTWVKIKEGWRNRDNLLRSFGFKQD